MTATRPRVLRVLSISLLMALVASLSTVMLGGPAQAGPTWLPGTSNLSTPGQDANSLTVDTGPDGTTTAIWRRYNGTNWIIQASTRSPGSTWTTPADLSAPGRDAVCCHPQVTAGPEGTATAAWLRYDDAGHAIVQAATRTTAGTWTAPTNLSDPGQNAGVPQVTTGPDGTTTAVWARHDGTSNVIQTSTLTSFGWTTPLKLSTPGTAAVDPAIAAAPDGAITAVWRINDGSHWIIQESTRTPGGTWSAPRDLAVPGVAVNGLRVASGPGGLTTAVWAAWNGAEMVVHASTRTPFGWTQPVLLSAPGESVSGPRVAIDSDGATTVVWSAAKTYHNRVLAVVRPAGGAWTAPTALSGDENATSPRVAVLPDGTTTAVWAGYAGSDYFVQAAIRSPGGGWTPPTRLSAPGTSFEPQVAASPDGTVTAVWRRREGFNDIAQSRVLDAAGPTISGVSVPPTGTAGHALSFTAAATDTWSDPTTLTWDFGDGATATGTPVTHAYTSPGTYTVKVTGTDAVGNTTRRSAGTVAVAAAATPPTTVPPVTTPPPAAAPRITGFSLTRKKISVNHKPRATKAVIALTAPAKVTLVFKKKGTRAQRKALRLAAGTTRVKITARLTRKTRLKPGTYVVTATAVNSVGTSTPRRTRLRIVS